MGYYDDADAELFKKGWYNPLEGQCFAGRKATVPLDASPWWDSNTMNWKLLIFARDWAWQQNQGLLGNYQHVADEWIQNNHARPGQAGPFPEPPKAFVAFTEWVVKVTGNEIEMDGNGNPVRMFYRFDVRQGSQPVCPTPAH
jgi:hypothetical protein